MFQYYTPVFLLQIFCLYHAYRHNSEQKWYWLIIFFPLGGGLIYLYIHFYNRSTIDIITENVKGVVITDYRINQLEKEMKFSDSIKTKTALADEYVRVGRYKDAIDLYTDCAQGFMADDISLLLKLTQTHFLHTDYESSVSYGKQLEKEKTFKNSNVRASYAWALHYTGKSEQAEAIFKDMDSSFTNYMPRTEYCKFLLASQRTEEAKSKLHELITEFDHMKGPERRLQKGIFNEIRALYDTIQRKTARQS